MKYLTFTVPCYNSESYMRRCVDSLLCFGTDAEIILVDDGSTDGTGEIADEYQNRFPDIVKAVHKENGGHGSGVNKGLEMAEGLYFKVVDSDDWMDPDACQKLLFRIRELCGGGRYEFEGNIPDLFMGLIVDQLHVIRRKFIEILYFRIQPEFRRRQRFS